MKTSNIDKQTLRYQQLKIRNAMSSEEVQIKSNSICMQLLQSKEYKEARSLFVYYPLRNEINILPFVKQGFKDQKRICFPVVVSKHKMKFLEVKDLDHFAKSKFKVLEPTCGVQRLPDEHSMIIIPGLAYDDINYRIGYGGGFYDNFITYVKDFLTLETAKNNLFGVFYKWQKVERLPIDCNDERLDCIITEQ